MRPSLLPVFAHRLAPPPHPPPSIVAVAASPSCIHRRRHSFLARPSHQRDGPRPTRRWMCLPLPHPLPIWWPLWTALAPASAWIWGFGNTMV
uniref:Uncharacterized protein n=1 Tax=Oryza glumipatula TaxID=40148 RepID=A0A0E0B9M8_9ORYZ